MVASSTSTRPAEMPVEFGPAALALGGNWDRLTCEKWAS
jgi:hypothetical protein